MHGGACLKGEAHPRYKHGKYSKYKVLDLDELLAKYAAMEPVDLTSLFAESVDLSSLFDTGMLADLVL
jgi:hypothetical protein